MAQRQEPPKGQQNEAADPRKAIFLELKKLIGKEFRKATGLPELLLAERKEAGRIDASMVVDETSKLAAAELASPGDFRRRIIALSIVNPQKAALVMDAYVLMMCLTDGAEGELYRALHEAAWLTCKLGDDFSKHVFHWAPLDTEGNYHRPETVDESLRRLLDGLGQCPPNERVVQCRKVLFAAFIRRQEGTPVYVALQELAKATGQRDAIKEINGVVEYPDEAARRLLEAVPVVTVRLLPYVLAVVESGILTAEEAGIDKEIEGVG